MGASASREKFRESVAALIEIDVSPDDAEFWDELWKIPSSTEEVFELISPEAARTLRDERFDNLATLFTQATAQMCQIVETPYSIYFDQALNCVRVLTRVIPFLLEKGDLGQADSNVENLCWGTGSSAENANNIVDTPDSLVGKVIGGEEDFGLENDDDGQGQEPLALLVLHATMHMLFLPQFTCEFSEENEKNHDDEDSVSSGSTAGPTQNKEEEEELTPEEIAAQAKEDEALKSEIGLGKVKVIENGVLLKPNPVGIVWAPGLGVKTSQLHEGHKRKFDKNRIEVLRLLLAACCDPLFSPADEYNPLASRWLAIAVAADAPNAICLFHSLMNTIISYEPSTGLVSSMGNDSHGRLVSLCVQVLCVLLDCGMPGNPECVKNSEGEHLVQFEEASKGGFNIFRTLLARIDSGKDLTDIYTGLTRLLRNVHESKNTLLPGSRKGMQCYQEILVIIWKLLEENPLFLTHVLNRCDVTELVVPVCYFMYQARKDPSQVGLIHICTFLLLKLSGERSFGVSLNKPFHTKLPCDIPLFGGGHADLITISLHKIVVNGAYKLVPLYSCFLTIICNISPYWRSMSLVAAVKLVNMFELFASPKFLYSSDKSYRQLALLLEVFNNVIQYQYYGNQHLIYAIIRRKDTYGKIATLTLARALSQCKKEYGERIAFEDDHKDIFSLKEYDEYGQALQNKNEDYSQSDGNLHFRPTETWLAEFKEAMPFETISRLLQHLVPVIDDVIDRKDGVVDEGEILDVLKNVTMVGLLPVPHAIVIRKYQPNQYTSLWFTAYLWGVVFLGNQVLPIFDGESIELFQVSLGNKR